MTTADIDVAVEDVDRVGDFYYDIQLIDGVGKTSTIHKWNIISTQDITKWELICRQAIQSWLL